MCLGRIYTDSEKFKAIKFIEVHNDDYVENKDIPTLIIGKQKAENIFGKERIKVLDKKIDENLYWTFGKMEKRNEYEKDIEVFYKNIFNNIKNKTFYTFISVYILSYKEAKLLLKYLKSKEEKYFFILNKHIYFIYKKKVLGISIEELTYIGIKYDKVIGTIKKNPCNHIIFDDNFVTAKVKSYTKDNKILVPMLYFANN